MFLCLTEKRLTSCLRVDVLRKVVHPNHNGRHMNMTQGHGFTGLSVEQNGENEANEGMKTCVDEDLFFAQCFTGRIASSKVVNLLSLKRVFGLIF